MGRTSKKPQVNFVVSEGLMAKIRASMRRLEMGLSEWMRQAAREKLERDEQETK
jgi:hypothetical protein